MLLNLQYNGHTTAADALWAGVPMLTLPGAKQIGRTAAGFAVALGCNDMVAASVKEVEDEACVHLLHFCASSACVLALRYAACLVCTDVIDLKCLTASALRTRFVDRPKRAVPQIPTPSPLRACVRNLGVSSGMH